MPASHQSASSISNLGLQNLIPWFSGTGHGSFWRFWMQAVLLNHYVLQLASSARSGRTAVSQGPGASQAQFSLPNACPIATARKTRFNFLLAHLTDSITQCEDFLRAGHCLCWGAMAANFNSHFNSDCCSTSCRHLRAPESQLLLVLSHPHLCFNNDTLPRFDHTRPP